MAGLESIALAVDFLERREGKKESADGEPKSSLLPPSSAPIPPRTGFLNSARRVSSDTVNEELAFATPAPAHSPANLPTIPAIPSPTREPNVVESISPEFVTQMVENLADDGEFRGPPPPPPPPTEIISRVMDCDVLCGRGGETNHHKGNVKYRSLVKRYQSLYIMSKRRDKPLIASKIVRLVRHVGGRFLRKDKNNSWRDVGNIKAREKTSQALREGAPDLRSPQKGGRKEDQSARTVVSHPSQSASGPGRHADIPLGSPCCDAGIGMCVAGASIVEGQPGEIDGSFHVAKKMRVPAFMPPFAGGTVLALPPQFWGEPKHSFLHGMAVSNAAASFVHGSAPTLTLGQNPPLVSPHSFAAAVSADDDESTGKPEERETRSPAPRGPRLKMLKKRLQKEQSGN